MSQSFQLLPNGDGTYDVIVQFDRGDTEFSLEFLSPGNLKKYGRNIADYIRERAGGVNVRFVRVMLAGVIIASLPFAALGNAHAASSKYSMAYLYGGTATQQIAYVDRTQGALNTVSPSYFDLNPNGSLKLNTPSSALVNSMHGKSTRVVPFLSNHWDRQTGVNALANYEALADTVAAYIEQYNLDGVNVDIENVTDQQRAQYTAFVASLRQKIPANKEVSVAVAANPKGWNTGWHGSYDYTALAKSSDHLVIMAYDEHWQGSEPGPVASIGWVEQSVKYALGKTSADKLVLAVPFYGRIWSQVNSFNGNGIKLDLAEKLIKDYGATVTFDIVSMTPKAEFTVKAGGAVNTVGSKTLAPGKYTLWYENDASIAAKLNLVNRYNLKGSGAWSLGQEPVSLWSGYSSWLDGSSASTTPTSPSQPAAPTPPAPQPTTPTAPAVPSQPAAPTAPSQQTVLKATVKTKTKLYKQMSTKSALVANVSKGATVTVLQQSSSAWYRVRLSNGREGYISAKSISINYPVKKTKAKVALLKSPSASAVKVTTLPKGAKVKIVGTSGAYTNVIYGSRKGYVLTQNLS